MANGGFNLEMENGKCSFTPWRSGDKVTENLCRRSIRDMFSEVC